MVTKKRLLLLASLPLTIAMILGVLALLSSRSKVTKANFDRIEKGMTMAEVEEIFGREGGEWAEHWMYWNADDGSWAVIEFRNNCVNDKDWQTSNEGFFDKIRRWLHLP